MKQSDIYTEALTCLRSILLGRPSRVPKLDRLVGAGHSGLEPAAGRLPTIFGHTEVWARSTTCPVCVEITTIFFDFLKSVCYAFGHLYGKREGISPEALMEECLHDVEQAAITPLSH